MFSFDTLDETKAKRKLHTYDKEAKAKRPHKTTLKAKFNATLNTALKQR